MNAPSPSPPHRRTRRIFYRVLLPALWLIGALGSFSHPGDEYGLFAAGNIAGLWSFFLIEPVGGSPLSVLPRVLATGVVTVGLIGWLLDLVRARRRVWWFIWPPLALVIGFITVASYPSYARAIAKNGSIEAYVFFSLNGALTLASIGLLIVTALIRLLRRRQKPGECRRCFYNLHGNTSGRCPECGTPIAELVEAADLAK
ncbi:MAG: hypothetical protein HZB38_02580 [Planctomycetes bacterium]|nr:hypothetical protein [Planctomycetota bacterium]